MNHPSRARILRAAMPILALCAATFAHGQEKRAFTIEDMYRIVTPGGIDLAPDGKAVVYALRSTDLPRGKSNTDLYIVEAGKEPRRLTWTEDASESAPIFSPDGKTIAFVAQRGDQKAEQIWLMPTGGGESRALTVISTGVSEVTWAPDGASLLFASGVYPECGGDDDCNGQKDRRRADGPLTAHVADELLYRHWTAWSDGKVSHIFQVEVESGEVRNLTPGERETPVWSLGGGPGYAVSPDGKVFCYTQNPDPITELASSTNSDLWVTRMELSPGGETTPAMNLTADNKGSDVHPVYSPDGRYMAYLSQERAGYESDLIRLMVRDTRSGVIRHLSSGFDNWVNEIAWMPDSKTILFSADVGGRTPLYLIPVAGGEPRQVADFAYIDEMAVAPDGKSVYVVRRSIQDPPEIYRLDLRGRAEPLRLTRHNLALQEEVDIRPAERIQVDVGGGRMVETFVVKPHDFDPGKKYPLILNVHGGPQMQWSDSFRGDWQVYPGAGYIVAFPNPSGSSGYGQAFTEEISRDWGGKVFDDVMKVTDHLETLPYVDTDRIGAMGWSYGGYMMNWFQGHTNRFKTLACMMGLFDLQSFYLTTEELWFPEWDLGGTPWDSDLYERWNPAASIAEFSTPMLIVTGELDYRVAYTQSLMAFTALRKRGIPSRLVVLPKSGHWPSWYEMALYYTAHLEWFEPYLGGDPAPWTVDDFAANAVFDSETGKRIDGEDASGD
jgi:dipeptidyl aminopeptidase/acylaminoacyl peptidase